MPESFLRFLRVYASIVVFLVSSVVGFGVEPVGEPNFANVTSVTGYVEVAGIAANNFEMKPVVINASAGVEQTLRATAIGMTAARTAAWAWHTNTVNATFAKSCGHKVVRVGQQS